jgi:hypothetical protein
MSTSIHDLIPNPDNLLALEPEELAGVVLEHLNTLSDKGDQLNRYNFTLHHTVAEYPREYHARLCQALMEAWVWLERESLLVPIPERSGGEWVVISRRGQQLKKAADVEAYRRANLLPRDCSIH